jgi:competence protein ComGC
MPEEFGHAVYAFVLLKLISIVLGFIGPNLEVNSAGERAAIKRLRAALAEHRVAGDRLTERLMNLAADGVEAGWN